MGERRKERKWKKSNTFHRKRDWDLETGELCGELEKREPRTPLSLLAQITERTCESLTDLNGKVE